MEKILIKNFTKVYKKFTAVNNINLEIKSGAITGFVGKNGAGKTTTLRAMINCISPTKGEILINGLDSVRDATTIKSAISYMPGDVALYENVKIEEILKFCANEDKAILAEAYELCQYFELDINKKARELSLGNRKKVSIVLALMKKSDVLILDEPTNGLDPLMQEKFFKKIIEKKENGSTIFLSSHNLSEIDKHCDRVVIIKDGKIIEDIDMQIARKEKQLLVIYETDKEEKHKELFDGDINELLNKLSKLSLKNLEIKKVPIEEKLMKYYEEY